MSTTYVADIQHLGKPGKHDVGAVRGDLQEASLAQVVHCGVVAEAAELGITTLGAGVGWYSERHVRVNEFAKASPRVRFGYIAHHINASGAETIDPYSTFGYDARSSGGKRLAEAIAQAVREAFPSRRVIARACVPDNWTKNMLNTIKGIYAGPSNVSAVCSEPLFMRELVGLSRDDRTALLRSYGAAMARGIDAWAKGMEG